MSTSDEITRQCADRLDAASNVMQMLSALFSAIEKLPPAHSVALSRVGHYLAQDWANALDVDSDRLPCRVREVRP